MSSPSRKVGLRKRISIAVTSAAAGAVSAAVVPFLFYRSAIRQAQSDKPKRKVDWNGIGNKFVNSGLFYDIMAELSGPKREDWLDDEEADEDFQEDSTVH